MTTSTQTSFNAICRQLDADYQPTLAQPLPRELKDLLAQLVEYERKRGPTDQRRERPHSLIA
jgi:hypothetical protein